ncbi:DUF4238 domain-containing protein [Acinetobacter sp. VNH17]|uniref:DUF4238 domain-containing protein n=1 Tax=Acinetobacter thutiue TaxID=2998078 RepID=A0ABT7WKW1_9GAMM|nr:DUF4238 domain-containing protein [Acinetobacter thutiue]MCY6411212.1 DUF4238 domain-containing protein [Acinetobacter thutiue]MDN0013314.1 DUF4238 domain-containing protein [Acinetobacter thutiue]
MNTSKNHHYVHESYQKRFYSQDKKLYVILKKDRYRVQETTAARICYIPYLNTIEFENNKFEGIETFYRNIESKLAEILLEIDLINNEYCGIFGNVVSEEEGQLLFKTMIALMFWRNPNQTVIAEKYIDSILEVYDAAHSEAKKMIGFDRKTIKFFQKNIKKESIRKFVQFVLLPIFTFKIYETSCAIRSFSTNGDILITCDNPIIFNEDISKLFSFEDFIMPVDSGRFFSSEQSRLSKLNISKINRLLADKAESYVLGSDRKYLEDLSNVLKNISNISK